MAWNNRHHLPPLDEKSGILATIAPQSRSSSTSSSSGNSSGKLSQRSPRVARFAEATSVNSPIDPPRGRNPFAGAHINTEHLHPQAQAADVGFGFMGSDEIKQTTIEVPMTPKTPLKSALKVPNTPGRFVDPRSPTFHEEVKVEVEEEKTEKQNANDVKVKKRVRVAKFFLRGVNFSCSLIILSMMSTTFSIINATQGLPSRGNFPAWAPAGSKWPQILILCVACLSLFLCMIVFYGYWKGGHRKAQKTGVYYTMFAIGFFCFTTVMWIVTAVVLHHSRANGGGQDVWGWACNNNKRATLFQDTVNYALVCRLQNWGLICAIIEIVVEVISISLYVIVGYRFWSKRKLHKSMNIRDKARSDLYLAQLKAQSAPNTPGLPKSAAYSVKAFGPIDENDAERGEAGYKSSNDEREEAQWAARHHSFSQPKSPMAGNFHLAAPPAVRVQQATPHIDNGEFEEVVQEHMAGAPGEEQYAAVPIPGAYADPMPSPGYHH